MRILLVVGSTTLSLPDVALERLLRTGTGSSVQLVDDGAAVPSLTNIDLIVISESCDSTTLGSKYANVDTPCVVLENAVWDVMHLGVSVSTATGLTDAFSVSGHPINDGHQGLQTFYTSPPTDGSAFKYSTTANLGAGAQRVVTNGTSLSDQNIVFAYDTGAALRDGFTAAARRVAFGFPDGGYLSWTRAANNVFLGAVAWAAGITLSRPKKALYITGSNSQNESERYLRSHLRWMGYQPTDRTHLTYTAEEGEAHDLVVISKTVESVDIADNLNGITTPIVFWEDNAQMTSMISTIDNSDVDGTFWHAAATQVDINGNVAASLRANLTDGAKNFYVTSDIMTYAPRTNSGTESLIPGAVRIAEFGSSGNGRWVVYLVPQEVELANGQLSAGPRGYFGLYDDTWKLLTADGVALFDALVAGMEEDAPPVEERPSLESGTFADFSSATVVNGFLSTYVPEERTPPTEQPTVIFDDVNFTDVTPPSITITSPLAGQSVSGVHTVTAEVTDVDSLVERVEFLVDGSIVSVDTAAPYSWEWDTTGLSDGNHILQVRAFDSAGNISTASVTVSVTNATGTPIGTAVGVNLDLTWTIATITQANDLSMSWMIIGTGGEVPITSTLEMQWIILEPIPPPIEVVWPSPQRNPYGEYIDPQPVPEGYVQQSAHLVRELYITDDNNYWLLPNTDPHYVPMLQITPSLGGVWLRDLDLGFPEIREVVSPRPGDSGTIDYTAQVGSRVVTMSGVVTPVPNRNVEYSMDLLRRWLSPRVRGRLWYRLENGTDRWMRIRASNFAAPFTMNRRTYNELTASWIGYEGVVYGNQNTRTIGNRDASIGDPGRVYDMVYSRSYPSVTETGNIQALMNNGNFPASPIIRFYGPCTNPHLSLISHGQFGLDETRAIGLTGHPVLNAGEFVELNVAERTVRWGEGSADVPARTEAAHNWRRYLSPRQWWTLLPGRNRVVYGADSVSGDSRVIVTWNDTYL